MSIRIVAARNTEITTLETLLETLSTGKTIKIYDGEELITTVRGHHVTDTRWPNQILLHTIPAEDFDHVIHWLEGDAHARSKIQFMGDKFVNFF